MDHDRRWKRIVLEELLETLPRHPVALAAAIEPPLPGSMDLVAKAGQGRGVSGNPIVRTMPLELPHQCAVLFRNQLMAMRPAPLGDRFDGAGKPFRRGLALHPPPPLAGATPVVSEAQQIERPRPARARVRRRFAEVHHPGLLRV